MADHVDEASALMEFSTGVALLKINHAGPSPTGICLNCEQKLDGERRWCDADCRDDWQWYEDRISINHPAAD